MDSVSLDFPANSVTAIIGPSGCGKSTYIRSLNRMHELVPNASTRGEVLLHGQDIYQRGADPVAIRSRSAWCSSAPTRSPPSPSPTTSWPVPVHADEARPDRPDDLVERTLRGAGLWGEVKNRLHAPAGGLSGGQQQRLCIARALSVEPDVLLMDEPCSALDPQSTLRIEDLIHELKQRLTIVIVTHNMQQAARVSTARRSSRSPTRASRAGSSRRGPPRRSSRRPTTPRPRRTWRAASADAPRGGRHRARPGPRRTGPPAAVGTSGPVDRHARAVAGGAPDKLPPARWGR